MHRALLLFWLTGTALEWAATPAWAADSASAATATAPNADSPSLQADAASQAGAQPVSKSPLSENCPDRPPTAQGAPSGVVVQLDPDTLWRPRGGGALHDQRPWWSGRRCQGSRVFRLEQP